jgi:hypothetical protein
MTVPQKTCPKGISTEDCPGKGNAYQCYLYDKNSDKCYFSNEIEMNDEGEQDRSYA